MGPADGEVLGVHLVPDFSTQLRLEGKIQDLKDLDALMTAQTSSGESYFNCCIPRRYRDHRTYQLRMDELEDKLMHEILKPFELSGHAFVCFNSIQAVNMVK